MYLVKAIHERKKWPKELLHGQISQDIDSWEPVICFLNLPTFRVVCLAIGIQQLEQREQKLQKTKTSTRCAEFTFNDNNGCKFPSLERTNCCEGGVRS